MAVADGLSLQAPRAEHDRNRHHDNRERHPILDMNAKGVDPLDKHLHGRFPDFGGRLGLTNREINQTLCGRLRWRPLSFENRFVDRLGRMDVRGR